MLRLLLLLSLLPCCFSCCYPPLLSCFYLLSPKAVRYSTRVSRYTSQACIVYRLGKLNIVSRIGKHEKHEWLMLEKLFLSLSLCLFPPPSLSLSLSVCVYTRPDRVSTRVSRYILPTLCIVYRLVYRDIFSVSTRVSTRQKKLNIAQPYFPPPPFIPDSSRLRPHHQVGRGHFGRGGGQRRQNDPGGGATARLGLREMRPLQGTVP